jgi:nicotinate-nucleotide pyrophosphorylase (carboxylating)
MPTDDALDVPAHLPLIARALEEDRAGQDVTSRAVVPAGRRVVADVKAKGHGVVAGLPLLEPVFRSLDPDVTVALHHEDGEVVGPGSVVATVTGDARAILAGERTALNLLGRLGGIASLTHRFVEAVTGTGTRILDTRKTTPGWRALEKYAVRAGGGESHRTSLADAAMVKENHLHAAFGATGPDAIREAVARCRSALAPGVSLCVEVEDDAEVEAALDAGVDVLMLDGFDLGGVRRAVRLVRSRPPPRPKVEVTGGVTVENVAAFAAAGADRVSVGALTHSAPALDVHLRIRD